MSDDVEFVQPRTLHNGPILLADPDPAWPAQYAAEEARIRSALRHNAVRVEHVGSTSVADLAAKPILDILLLVRDPVVEADYVPALENVGYLLHLREPGWHQHRLLKRTEPAVNLHVFAADSVEPVRMLRFRDWLRAHPDDRRRYESTKRQLAGQHWARVQDYADAKTEVVEDILARAMSDGEGPGSGRQGAST
jgi:GrpB-like predicted nucleotidyltransferase (UPF0157 family)